MIIEVKNVKKIYKTGSVQVTALDDINFSVDKGEFLAIMGQSGSGKSTMMNILGCLDRASAGDYILQGINVSTLEGNELAEIRNKKIGFVFQSFNLLPRLSAIGNIELPMIYAGVKAKERRERAFSVLKKVGLEHRINHKPNELSGGQKQRVAIARSLVNNPAIILADEPTGNLDSRSSSEILDIFEGLNAEGATVIIVTHEPDIAARTKRTLSFFDGKIVSDKPTELKIT